MARSSLLPRKRRGDAHEDGVASPNRRKAPRIIGQDRRRLLTHLERAGWIGGRRDLLSVWRDYAEHFIRSRPLLSPEERSWLISRGFHKDATWLYRLPGEHAENYVSDLQLRLMPQVNGLDSALLANRTLFMQVFRESLPWPILLGQAVAGRIVRDEAAITAWRSRPSERRACSRPALVAEGAVSILQGGASTLVGQLDGSNAVPSPEAGTSTSHDTQLMGLPPCSGWLGDSDRTRLHRFKLLLLRHPDTRRFVICGACLVLGHQHGRFTRDTVSLHIDIADGRPLSAVHRLQGHLDRGITCCPWDGSPLPASRPPGWNDFTARLLHALDGLPLLEWLQVELDLSEDGFTIVDTSDRLDAAAFQVHVPLMRDATCRRFLMEYCL